MQKNRKVWLIAIPLILILGILLYDSFSQPTVKDLAGDFEEVAFVRNEQNKGGIIRLYAVTVGNPAIADYEKAADLFPTNDYNSVTRIYFFDKKDGYPTTLSLDTPHYDTTKYKAINIIKRTGAKQ